MVRRRNLCGDLRYVGFVCLVDWVRRGVVDC